MNVNTSEENLKIFTNLSEEIMRKAELNGMDTNVVVSENLVEIKNYNMNFFQKLNKKLINDSCGLVKNKTMNKIIIFALLSLCAWLITYILFDNGALPGGVFFSLAILVVTSHVFGFVFSKMKLPALLGKFLLN